MATLAMTGALTGCGIVELQPKTITGDCSTVTEEAEEARQDAAEYLADDDLDTAELAAEVYLRAIVNNPDCYTPQEVDEAQRLLDERP